MMETRGTLKIITDSVSVPLASLRQGESPDGRAEEAVSLGLRRNLGPVKGKAHLGEEEVVTEIGSDVHLECVGSEAEG